MKKQKPKKSKFKELILFIKIKITLKNIFINIIDGDCKENIILFSSSMGLSKIFGPKKSSPLSTQVVVKNIISKLKNNNCNRIAIVIKGHSRQTNRLSCIETFKNFQFEIVKIIDSLPQSHNGCRPRKFRRDRRNMILY